MKHIALLCLLFLGGSAFAIPFDPVDLTGFRTSLPGGGIAATQDWDDGGFSLSWTISKSLDVWNYSYEIQARKGISHTLLETSAEFDFARDLNDFMGGTWEAPPPGDWTDQQGNPDLPVATFHGFKAEPNAGSELDWSFSFESPRAPTWGSFYTKDGETSGINVTAWNNGLENPSEDKQDYVATPDTETVPEAGTLMLMSLGSLAAYACRKRRKQ